MTPLQKAGHEIKRLNDEVLAIHNTVDERVKSDPTVDALTAYTTDEVDRVKQLNRQIEELEKKVADSSEFQKQRDAAEARKSGIHFPGPERSKDRGIKTFGDIALQDPEMKAFLERMAKNGSVSSQAFGSSPSVDLGISAKALVTSGSTSAGALIEDDVKPIIDRGTFYRELTIFDLITVGETNSDAVAYVREGTHTNAADVTPQATGTGNGTGAAPESNFVLSRQTATVKAITHFKAAAREALADAPQMRTLIDTFLRYGVNERAEEAIITDDGTGDNFTGILADGGVTQQAWDTNLIVTTRKARTKVRFTGKARANGYMLHPNDWEDLDLLQDNEARYFFGGPSQMGTPRLWGLPVVESESVTEGYGICADFRLCVAWMRANPSISISDSHADFFIRRMIAILAEMRMAFALIRPAAFVKMDLTA